MKKLIRAITKQKNQLKNRVKNKGIYENFGQREVDKIKDKFIDISSYTDEMNKKRDLIQNFNEWCMTYNGE